MKKLAVAFAGLFLFGTYALPGKVCPNACDRRAHRVVQSDEVPPCHRVPAASPKKSPDPCSTMVCCLVPDVTRETVPSVVMPAPGGAGSAGPLVSLPFFASPLLCRYTDYESQAPPGSSGSSSFQASPRGPPLA